ncbi:hypothetical protein QBC34DRAFT_455598 [Podospora aff. communis PSN243]|uniref:NACHT domain-containing protein n=1 Tax=Podospora aff. communis PSN243 TaxID=3040156 RepID=A0AAV9GVL8_9PEZI|nr:hypothetical protein QBC34DRAFT_455598 [Podospora aff. communis PSN243]
MDPVTIIGIAGSVVQFVSFAFQLISKTKDIHESAGRQSKETAKLDAVYTHLLALSSKLEASSKRDAKLEVDGDDETTTTLACHVFAVNDLSVSCEADCQKLLDIIRKLQGVSGSGGKWGSFRVAVATMWKSSELEDLEDRLQKTQTTLTLHICALTTHWHGMFDRQLRELRKESIALDAKQSEKLDGIAKSLDEIKARVANARLSKSVGGFEPDDVEVLGNQLSRLSLFREAAAKENLILRSLSFESRPVRHSSIPSAYSRTFEWAFEGQEVDGSGTKANEWSHGIGLLDWLKGGQDIFWVSGKPGSGKSTFMKFLADHSKTEEALACWASRNRLVIASHYFWSAGTTMQKSKQGLLQTLLYEIFRQLPGLIETACIERWPRTPENLSHEVWLLPELQRVLQRLADLDMEVKFCFFIDGLDEFEGDHVDFCRSLLDLIKSPHIKLCVSSRSWNVFEDAFGGSQYSKLYMHELTHNDIRSYAERRLQEHPRWNELTTEVSNADWLIDQIAERAAGVFLWVFLVTGQLRNGLTEYDSVSDLQRRLERIPDDLEAFFRQILESVEPFYHPKMATTLLISLQATEPAPISIYTFHDTEYEDPNYALRLPLEPLPKSQQTARNKQTSRRLSARCRGLLEITKGSRVEFLHRSVMDFLRTNDMASFLSSKVPDHFNAHLSLIRAYTAYIKTTRFPQSIERTYFAEHTPSPFTSSLREIMVHAKLLEATSPDDTLEETLFPLLDELDTSIPQMERKSQIRINALGDNTNTALLVYRELVLDSHLVKYLNYRLPRDTEYFVPFKGPPLSAFVATLMGRCADPGVEFGETVRVVRCLLENGCDPNEGYLTRQTAGGLGGKGVVRTPWEDLVAWPATRCANTCCRELPVAKREARKAALEEVLGLMLDHGADRSIWPGTEAPEEGCIQEKVSLMMGTAQKRRSDSSDDSDSKSRKSKGRRRS